jgi:Na+/H+ antiporter NhaA
MELQRRLISAQEWLYIIIVASLALYLVIGVVVWAWMIFSGITAPEAFTTIIATIAGGLVGIATPLRGPATRSTEERSEPDR